MQIGCAITEFKKYMLSHLADKKRLIAEGEPGSGTLMSNLVRASDAHFDMITQDANEPIVISERPYNTRTLSVEEILGNVSIFHFAGHDTTATSLAYSMLLLSAPPEVQDWISEELDVYLRSGSSKEWDYKLAFPKLKRCLAVRVSRLPGKILFFIHLKR